MSALLSLGLLAAAASPVTAFWRLPCKAPIVVERTDPIVNPNAIAGHVHTIMGGNGFSASMTYNDTQESTCASCTVIGDNSNYWVPSLYFKHQDGSFESVEQNGGALIYYLQRAPRGVEMKAFPPGFQMLAGDPYKRSGGSDFPSQAISYACLDYNGPAKKETGGFPNYNCPNGLRAQVFFPSCWDGVNLDSADHKSHVAYPIDNYNGGKCPSSHPVALVSIFYEVLWETNKFADKWYGSAQPFVWSNGDPTGYGYHGDFVNGWEIPLLQSAINTCTADSGRVEDCSAFTLRPDRQAEGCTINGQVDEEVFGTLAKLPGCNNVVGAPGPAPKPSGSCASNPSLGSGSAPAGPSVDGWTYIGCGTDNYYNRALTKARTAFDDMTNAKCGAFCAKGGYKFFGTEYAKECYCDNVIPDEAAPIPGVNGLCKMPCAGGDGKEMCGGSGTLSLFQQGGSGDAPTSGGGVGSGSSSGGSGSGSSSAGSSTPTNGGSTPSPSSGSGSSNGGSIPSANAPIDTSNGSGTDGIKNNVGSGSGSGSGSSDNSSDIPSGSGSDNSNNVPSNGQHGGSSPGNSTTTMTTTTSTTSTSTSRTTATPKPTRTSSNWENAHWENIKRPASKGSGRSKRHEQHAELHARRARQME